MSESFAYCDYIANQISNALFEDASKETGLLRWVTKPKLDLHPEKGYMLSTKKTVNVLDINGKNYLVTVEEV